MPTLNNLHVPPAVMAEVERIRASYRPNHPPSHSHAGNDSERAGVGDPGHCEACAVVGHVVAHPDYGCGDVQCNSDHTEGDIVPPVPAPQVHTIPVSRRHFEKILSGHLTFLMQFDRPEYGSSDTVILVEDELADGARRALPTGRQTACRLGELNRTHVGTSPQDHVPHGMVIMSLLPYPGLERQPQNCYVLTDPATDWRLHMAGEGSGKLLSTSDADGELVETPLGGRRVLVEAFQRAAGQAGHDAQARLQGGTALLPRPRTQNAPCWTYRCAQPIGFHQLNGPLPVESGHYPDAVTALAAAQTAGYVVAADGLHCPACAGAGRA